MYQAELSEASVRGRLVCSEPLFVGVGIVSSSIALMGAVLIVAGYLVLF